LQSLDLAELRTVLEEGRVDEYLEQRHISEELLEAMRAVMDAFEEGAQAELGEWT
jgi:hypothetical protein